MAPRAPVPKFWRWDGRGISPFRGGIPISDRGFRYGQHLFESMAVRDKRVLFVREHLESLFEASERAGIPAGCALRAALLRFLGNVSLMDGMLRLYLTAGEGAPTSPVIRPECYLAWEATSFPSPASLRAGISLKVLREPFLGTGWGEKSGNYLPHLTALEAARSAGADEAVVTDAEGRVLSAAMGNLLVWMPRPRGGGSVLCTPSPGTAARSGPRAGVVLGWVRQQFCVKDRALKLRDLHRADAVAVTNSRLGVMPVLRIDGRRLPAPSLSCALAESYLRSHGLLGNA